MCGPRNWQALHNPQTNELFVHVFDPDRGHKYVLTNTFKCRPGGRTKYRRPVWDEYSGAFSVCDRMNAAMTDWYWPFREMGWKRAVSSFAMTVALFNTYALHQEARYPEPARTFQEVMKELALGLYRHALLLGDEEAHDETV